MLDIKLVLAHCFSFLFSITNSYNYFKQVCNLTEKPRANYDFWFPFVLKVSLWKLSYGWKVNHGLFWFCVVLWSNLCSSSSNTDKFLFWCYCFYSLSHPTDGCLSEWLHGAELPAGVKPWEILIHLLAGWCWKSLNQEILIVDFLQFSKGTFFSQFTISFYLLLEVRF